MIIRPALSIVVLALLSMTADASQGPGVAAGSASVAQLFGLGILAVIAASLVAFYARRA